MASSVRRLTCEHMIVTIASLGFARGRDALARAGHSAIYDEPRRLAQLHGRHARLTLLAPRSDQRGELRLARGRVAIQDRFTRARARSSSSRAHRSSCGGVLYTTGGTNRAVVALDAVTGAQRWVHREDEGPRGAAAPRLLSGRGLAYWTDGREERILYVTPGYQLIALDAKTGDRIASFGTGGAVDLKTDIDQTILPDLDHRRNRLSGRAGRRPRRDRHRCGVPRRHGAEEFQEQ